MPWRTLPLIASFLLLGMGVVLSKTLMPPSLSTALYLSGYVTAGFETFWKLSRGIQQRRFLDENLLLVLATTGALALREFAEAAMVMTLYRLGELLEGFASERSHRFIGQLVESKTKKVHVQKDGHWVEVFPQMVKTGDVFRVHPGEKILLDGIVLEGSSHLDTSSLTGEPLPLFREKGDEIQSGSVNLEGSLMVRATRDYEHSTIRTIVQILQNALRKKAPTERFITRFACYYTPLVILLACSLLLVPLFKGTFNTLHLYQALTILMISYPCALVISIPLGFLAGIGKLAQAGILIKGSSHLEDLAHLTKVFFDKTGTLTQGKFRIKEVQASNGQSIEGILRFASIAASCSPHPLAQVIWNARKRKTNLHFDYYQEIPGAGIITKVDGQQILLGNERFLKGNGIFLENQSAPSGATAHLAHNGKYLGYIVLEDPLKDDAAKTIATLKKNGVEVCLLSGDTRKNVARIAQEIGIETFFAELLPQEKVKILEKFLQEKKPQKKIALVGDGFNDAPALARADLGIAMGQRGIDMAIELPIWSL